MDTEAFDTLVALKKVNDVLLEGLKAAIFILENNENLIEERRLSLIESLRKLITAGETGSYCGNSAATIQ